MSTFLQLLEKDPKNRLGTKNGFEDLKQHPWLADIDWDQIEAKKVVPPYKPKVDKADNFEFFDFEFTQECNI